jgi:hypothetical protein
MADIDRATLVVAIQTVEMALAQARLREAYDRERQFDPKLLSWETLARAGRGW